MADAMPKKLKQDAIVEALLEIRFDSNEQSEIVIGRLSDSKLWSGYTVSRLASANLPENIREADAGLKYQPVLERRSQQSADSVRIGSHVLSYHVYAPYIGWNEFQLKLNAVVALLFDKVPNVIIRRLGFRYVNFLVSDKHEISDFADLALRVELKGEEKMDGISLTLDANLSDNHQSISRVVDNKFLPIEIIPKNFVCAIDVDIFTPADYSTSTVNEVYSWLHQAHIYEKEAFFSFLTKDTIDNLIEE